MGPRSRELLARLTDADLVARGVPVPGVARDLARLGARARVAGDLRRRAGLGAVRSHGARGRRVRRGRRGRRAISGCVTPATTRWTPCASRRPIAAGGTTSAARTRRSRPSSGSRCAWTSARRSPGATPCWRAAREAAHSAARRVRLSTTRMPLLYHDEPIWRDGALVGRIAVRRLRPYRWAAPSGSAGSPARTASPATFVASGRWEVEIALQSVVPARAPARATATTEVASRARLTGAERLRGGTARQQLAPVALGHGMSVDPVRRRPAPVRQVGGAEGWIEPRQVHREVLVDRGSRAWCQWWKRGVATHPARAPPRPTRTLAWMKTAWNETKTRYA